MDDYILQILKANAEAKEQVQEVLESHADDIQKLQQEKKKIDQELAQLLTNETDSLQKEMDSYRESLEPVYDQDYEQRVLDLRNRFNDAKEAWYERLLESIVTNNGK